MKRTRLTGAIAEKNHADLALFFFFGGKCRAKRQRYRSADHPGGSDKAGLQRDDVHRAPLAAAVAARASGNFRHKPIDIRSFSKGMTMRAVPAEYEIVLAQQTADADRDRFLANSQVKQADDLPFGVKRRDFFFKSANQPHPAQEIDKIL